MKRFSFNTGQVTRRYACLFELGIALTIAVCLLSGLAFAQEPVTGTEKREALRVAGECVAQFEKTGDFSFLLNDTSVFPALDFGGAVITEIGLAPQLKKQVNPAELRELVVTYSTFGILCQQFREGSAGAGYPASVSEFLAQHPLFEQRLNGQPDGKLQTLNEFREYLSVLKQATRLMQQSLLANQKEPAHPVRHFETAQEDSTEVVSFPCSKTGNCPPSLRNNRFLAVRLAGMRILLTRIADRLKVVFVAPDAD
ncbi:MAG: hypothetical protein K1Y36_01970 [Blastocatellia bacterium]|nr:hypothetical protein [Blastocatellia bacterium]